MARLLTFVSRVAAPHEPLAGSDIADAREALEYWTRRESDLPWYRRAARRECRRMIASWRATLVGAHLERWRLHGLREAVVPLLDTGERTAGQLAWRWMRRSFVGRVLLAATLAVTALSVATLALVVAVVVLLANV